jgi:flagellar biosynthesis/type III secretory pathway M-ring protein FliF/YscJ
MTTMKDGPGSDPFSDDEDQADGDEATTESKSEPEPETPETEMNTTEKYPYVLRRDTVKDERDNEHVAFLRDEFADLEQDIVSDVADELDMRVKDVSVTDVREAMVQVASENPERMAEVLLDWGYDAKQ